MQEFHRRMPLDPMHQKAKQHLQDIEALATRFEAAFPKGEFDDAKATLQLNISEMKNALAPKKK